MPSDVNSEIILLDKSLPTLGTQVGLGQLHPDMAGDLVALQVARRLEGFVTDVTEERFLSRMCSHVGL